MDAYANQIDVLEAMSAIFDAQQRMIALAQQDMVTILDQTWKALYATIFDGGSLVADLVLGVAGAVVSIATAGAGTAWQPSGRRSGVRWGWPVRWSVPARVADAVKSTREARLSDHVLDELLPPRISLAPSDLGDPTALRV